MGKPISKKMLINVMHPEEARVAIVHDGRLMELNIEISGKEQTKGNIYKGVVVRVEPGLQAAFVDIGRGKPGFLQMGELHPDNWQWRDDVPEDQRSRRPRIQEILRRGQELLVQVEKDERDNKGAALTTYLSLPGRYIVLMPASDSSGISRKVEQESERKKLKEIISSLEIPAGIGYIVRTEAVGRSDEELQKDLENLLELYRSITQRSAEHVGPGEVYRDSGLIIRSIRDYFSDDIDEVLVDNKDAYREAKEFFRETMPKCEKRVKLHREKRPIFSRFQLEEQIDQIYEKRVSLPSGGSLIIEPTEALVSIDVNSGKGTGERGVEDTAFKTNLEAAEEVARQLRLRDLGGLIVIDFIDMREKKHDIEVEKTLKAALKMDKARVNLGRISQFGILEMSRQRIAKTLNDAIHQECPHCEGRGKVKSVEAMALSFLRKVHAAAAKGTIAGVHGGLPLEVAYYLLNRKKRELAQIENDYEIEVTVKGKPSFMLNQLELDTVKRDKSRIEEPEKGAGEDLSPIVPAELPEEHVAVPSAELSPEPVKKKKRRKKKKKAGIETIIAASPQEAPVEPEESQGTPSVQETAIDLDQSPQEVSVVESAPRPKKRRRRKKSASPVEPGEVATVSSELDFVPTPEPLPTPEPVLLVESGAVPENTPKVPRRRAPRPRKAPESVIDTVLPDSPVGESLAPPAPVRAKRSRKVAVPPEVPVVNEGAEALTEVPTEPKKPVSRRRKKPQEQVDSN